MPPEIPRARLVLAFFCIYVVWGTTYLGVAILLRWLPPFTSAALRFTLAASLLYGWLRWHGGRPLAGLPLARVAASGVLMCGFGNGFTVVAMQGLPSGVAALLNSTIPIVILLLDWGFFARRRPGPLVFAGLAVGIAGVALIVRLASAPGGAPVAGYVAALALAVTTWSIGTLVQRGAVPPGRLLALGCGQMIAGAVFLWFAALLNGEAGRMDLAAVPAPGWLALLYLAAFGSVLAQTSYLWLLSRMPAGKVTTYALVNPVVAVMLGVLVLGETLTPASAAGAGLVLLGVTLVLFEARVVRALSAFGRAP